jgi:hypothetical protein
MTDFDLDSLVDRANDFYAIMYVLAQMIDPLESALRNSRAFSGDDAAKLENLLALYDRYKNDYDARIRVIMEITKGQPPSRLNLQ